MSDFRLTVVANYAAVLDNGKVFLEASHPLVLEPLAANGLKVTIAAPSNVAPDANRTGVFKNLESPGVAYKKIGEVNSRSRIIARALGYFNQIVPMFKHIASVDFAYIFFAGHTPIIAVFTCWILRKPYALYIRSELGQVPRVLRPFLPFILKHSKFLIVTGNKLAENLSQEGYRATPVVPLSPLLWKTNLHRTSVSSTKGIVLLFVGQMIREKGIFELIDAFSQLQRSITAPLHLNMIGVGQDLGSLQVHALRLGVQTHITFHGLLSEPEELASVFATSSIFVLPTYHEGFPRVLWEAMAFELPIVTTPVGQIPTELTEGFNAMFCEPRSATSLTEVLKKLVHSPELRKTLAKGANRTWQEKKVKFAADKTHGDQILNELKSLEFID